MFSIYDKIKIQVTRQGLQCNSDIVIYFSQASGSGDTYQTRISDATRMCRHYLPGMIKPESLQPVADDISESALSLPKTHTATVRMSMK
jgi:hypothetical protein